MLYRLLRALLFLLPAETAHHLGIWALELLGATGDLRSRLRRRALRPLEDPGVDLRTQIAGLDLEHPLMLAAGLDKDAVAVEGLFALGFSAVEVGTFTPEPQPGNPRPRLFRIPARGALINRMGFNNQGAQNARLRLRALEWRPGPVGVNIGKNKSTPLPDATGDYLRCVDLVAPWADYVVVNASSPNTPGLRTLQEPEQLSALLEAVRSRMDDAAPGTPLFLKIAPDLGPEAIDAIVDAALEHRVDGLIATNTTLTRPGAEGLLEAEQAGGYSGRGLLDLSTRVLARAFLRAGGRLPLIGVGGVFTAEDAYRKIRAGASAVQLYTGFIYGGPSILPRILAELRGLLRADGCPSLQQAVGADAAREAASESG